MANNLLQALLARAKTKLVSPSNMPTAPQLPDGLARQGNIDLYGQPEVQNPDGSRSTVDTIGVNFGGMEYVLPRVTPDGRHLDNDQAIAEFQRTKRHLGAFWDTKNAGAFAEQLHKDYERGKYRTRPKGSQ